MRLGSSLKGFKKNKRIVAVTGLSQGVGTTHLAVMLATYLVHGRHRRVAIVEYGQHGSYEKIRRIEKSKRVRLSTEVYAKHGFSIHGIDFYESIDCAGAIGVLREYYDDVIVDMKLGEEGCIFTEEAGRMWQADIRIAVASTVPWKQRECTWKLDRLRSVMGTENISVVSTTRDQKAAHKKILLIPWEPDPFHIHSENQPWLQKLIEL